MHTPNDKKKMDLKSLFCSSKNELSKNCGSTRQNLVTVSLGIASRDPGGKPKGRGDHTISV